MHLYALIAIQLYDYNSWFSSNSHESSFFIKYALIFIDFHSVQPLSSGLCFFLWLQIVVRSCRGSDLQCHGQNTRWHDYRGGLSFPPGWWRNMFVHSDVMLMGFMLGVNEYCSVNDDSSWLVIIISWAWLANDKCIYIYVYIYICIYICVCLFIFFSIYLSIYLFIYLYIYLFLIYSFVCLFIFIYKHLFVELRPIDRNWFSKPGDGKSQIRGFCHVEVAYCPPVSIQPWGDAFSFGRNSLGSSRSGIIEYICLSSPRWKR